MMGALNKRDIQGFLFSGYATMHRASYLMLRVGNDVAARRWLASAADRMTNGEGVQPDRCLNVALTCEGLRALGIAESDLKTFPVPFREGMTYGQRPQILGDIGDSDPSNWDWGGRANDSIHVLVMIFAKDDKTFRDYESEEIDLLSRDGGFEIKKRLEPEPLPGKLSVGKFGVEHFGFADGMSQPVIKGSGQELALGGDDYRRTVIDPGEFILGYENGYGKLTPWPKLKQSGEASRDFGLNGTYLVFRQLYQDVSGFWKFIDKTARDYSETTAYPDELRNLVASKLVGRWPSGAPLVEAPYKDDPQLGVDNSFGYAAWDEAGTSCPIGSHIRRANPRDSLHDNPAKALELANLHRLIRRGRVYGPGMDDPFAGDDGQDRGLFFMCLNANLERQFEFVQHTWINNPSFAGLLDEQDPLIGNPMPEQGTFTIQEEPFRRRVKGLSSFVTTKGGEYFFLPGIKAFSTFKN